MAAATHFETVGEYVKVASHEAKKGDFKRCLLLYSGGLDTSVMLKYIQEEYESEVVALTLNIGQTADDLTAIKEKALRLGAIECVVVDARDRFADSILSEAIKANADYQGGYALGCPLGRVIISQIAVEWANKWECQVIGHGCTGKGNDQVRFEGYITTLNPKLKCIAPVREWGMGREEELKYAEEHGIEVKQSKDKVYSYDENMWSNTAEGGEIEDPTQVPKFDAIYQWCKTPEKAPDTPTVISVEYDKGVPVALNGEKMKLSELIAAVNKVGGENAVGVFPLIEDRILGLKVRGIYENPAAHILIQGHKNLEKLVSTREENELKTLMDTKWAYMVYGAKWFEPTMSHIKAYIDDQNEKCCGTVQMKLYKGACHVLSVDSKYSLFDMNLATFERTTGEGFNQNASASFIELYNLAQKTSHNVFTCAGRR